MDLPGPDEFNGPLADDLKARVKSELEPGERLLWAARAHNRHDRVSGVFLGWVFVAVVLAVVGFVSWVQVIRNPLGEISGRLGIGFFLGVFDVFVVTILFAVWKNRRSARDRVNNTLYALTDRRAIIWSPAASAGAVKVVTVPRGSVAGVHRVQYPDGSGDIAFRNSCAGFQFSDEYHAPLEVGFFGVAEVRRVEEMVRRTLASDEVRSSPIH